MNRNEFRCQREVKNLGVGLFETHERIVYECSNSFPSGHSSFTALSATLAARNLQSMDMSANYRRAMKIGFGVVAGGAAWARVEANVHFPSDVLVGAAIGHFIAAFINDAFIGLDRSDDKAFDLSLAPDFVAIQFQLVF